jgi:uncharacterized metal-binding protein YceD (DUF177 family)
MSEKEEQKTRVKPEWSHIVEAIEVNNAPLRKKISASPQQRKDLARRMDVISLDKLEADIKVQRTENKFLIHAEGSFKGVVTQECVVTGQNVENEISGEVEGWFSEGDNAVSLTKVRHEKMSQMVNSEVPVLNEKEDPEIIENGTFDLGELVVQHAILEIDLYPRVENASHPEVIAEEDLQKQDKKINNPFAALKNWKEKQQSSD